MERLQLIGALRYGAIGLGFVLAVLSYRLLRREQDRDVPNAPAFTAIYIYMLFSLLLAVVGFAAEYAKNQHQGAQDAADLRRQLTEARNQIAAKDELLNAVPVAVDPQPAASAGAGALSGEWDFAISATAGVNAEGIKRQISDEATIRVQLNQAGRDVSGKYLWATGRACTRANITGAIVGSAVELVVIYSGGCCGGAKMRITGKLLSSKHMDLVVQPIGIPPRSDCDIWWASGVGTRAS
jgi:hypothetical protein